MWKSGKQGIGSGPDFHIPNALSPLSMKPTSRLLALLALAVLAESLLGNRYLNLKTGTES